MPRPPLPAEPHLVTDYRIEKVRCPVTVVLTDGECIAGDIFLNTTSRFRAAPQDPAEFLNQADEGYFAVAAVDGRAMLVAKENVERVEAPGITTPAQDPSLHAIGIALTVSTGAVFEGSVLLDTPEGRSRLLDYLNSHREQFLQVHQPDRVMLVNRRAITHVRELN